MSAARNVPERIISSATLRKMIISASKMLEENKAQVDALNVFPVPDGDTGTNMSLTMASVLKELAASDSTGMAALADAVSKGALKGARGNSGVILSQILKGFCQVIATAEEADPKLFARALRNGAELAYSAVSKPREGTILTVIRVIAESALDVTKHAINFEEFLNFLITSGEKILAQTPDMLDVLKRAGVVDSGGFGLVVFLKGMLLGYLGQDIPTVMDYLPSVSDSGDSISDDNKVILDYDSLDDIVFGYCTEFFIINIFKKTTVTDIDKLRATYNELGDSVLVIGDLSLVKVHIHTNNPGVAISHALNLGEVDKIKIENMREQNRALKKKMEAERKPIGILAVCAGDGFRAIFKDLLTDQVIEGGQTMNPSAEDIAQAIRKINAESVIVLPNNKNIILAAEQSRSLVPTRKVYIVPTKDLPGGLAALLVYNANLPVAENVSEMTSVLQNVNSGSVTYAVRNSEINGLKLKEGDLIGLRYNDIVSKGTDVESVMLETIEKTMRPDNEVISLYYGKDVQEEDAAVFVEKVQEKFPDCEVNLFYGGQPLYYYIFSLE